VPSGLNATALTQLLWASGGVTGVPLRASHTRAVWSSLAVASRVPSGLNATAKTPPLWTSGGVTILPVRRRRPRKFYNLRHRGALA